MLVRCFGVAVFMWCCTVGGLGSNGVCGQAIDGLSNLGQPGLLQPRDIQLVTRDDRGVDWFLGSAGADPLNMVPAGAAAAVWTAVPAGRGILRLQQRVGGTWLALSAQVERSAVPPRLSMTPAAQDAAQLWHVAPIGASASGYWLESVAYPGLALTGSVGAEARLLPTGNGNLQIWTAVSAPLLPDFEPLWRTVSQAVRSNPALEVAQIDLVNSHSKRLVVLIGDRRIPDVRQVRMDPGGRARVSLDRDPGGTLVEIYEVRDANGLFERREFLTAIPAAPIYDVSVFEEFLQSIAIDRTGTSPNVIEDINIQPRSIGWIALPAGSALPQRGQLDVFARARAANNPGAVRRFQPQTLEPAATGVDPLEAILRSVKPPVRRKF